MSQAGLKNQIILFSDGACSGNPGPGGWGTLILFPNGTLREIGGFQENTTNNQMELTAVIRGLEAVQDDAAQETEIYSDSTYVIRGVTQWVWGWQKKGWLTQEGTPVANQELWKSLLRLTSSRKIKWHYVRGHSGSIGNERADTIAVTFSKRQPISLYEGLILQYPLPILELPPEVPLPDLKNGISSRKKSAPLYLSLVDGVLMRHTTWQDCESRVKGKSGARFKKVADPLEEDALLKSWGLK